MTRAEADALARLDVVDAVTLIRPWPWAIFNAGKDVENRHMSFPAPKPGTLLAIHAGAKFEARAIIDIVLMSKSETHVPMRDGEHPCKAIVGVVHVDAVTYGVAHRKSPWYQNEMGIWISKPVAIEPVPCRGQLGRWRMKPDTQDLVQSRFRAALRQLAR